MVSQAYGEEKKGRSLCGSDSQWPRHEWHARPGGPIDARPIYPLIETRWRSLPTLAHYQVDNNQLLRSRSQSLLC